jgi:ethanolamine utilization microcompartment shell protein EutL
MADKTVADVITAIEQEIKAAEEKLAELVSAGEQEAVKIEEAVVARLKAILQKILGSL